jgi:hypothetical protein
VVVDLIPVALPFVDFEGHVEVHVGYSYAGVPGSGWCPVVGAVTWPV